MAITQREDMYIPQGATYIHVFTYTEEDEVTPIDISSYTARMQIRASVKSTTVLHEATTEDGGIAITGPAGQTELTISDTDTAAFAFTKAVYDLELIAPDTTVGRLIKGKVIVDPEVTR